MNKRIIETLKSNNNKNSNIAIWLMRQAGRYLPEYQKTRQKAGGFLNLCYNPDLACEVTLQPIKRFDLDAAIIFSDILVIPDSLGINLKFEEKKGPILEVVTNQKDLDKLTLNSKKLEKTYEAIVKTKENLAKEKTLIGFSGAAWTLAAYMIEGQISKDLSVVKSKYYNDKNFFHNLLEILIENISCHLIRQIKSGVDVIQIFDSWAGVLTDKDYDELVIIPTKAIIKKVRAIYPDIPIICFPRMSGLQYQKFCLQVDCDAISIDQYMSLSWAKENCNNKIIQGNLDPIILLSNSTDLIKERVDHIFSQMEGKNFIFNLGHGVLPKTPPENVEFLVNYIKSIKQKI